MLADLRCACRSLYRRPAYTLAGTAALGLAVGVALAGLLLVRAVFSRPLPLDEPDRVVSFERHRRGEGVSTGFTYPEFARLEQDSAGLFDAVSGSGEEGLYVTTPAGAETASVSFVTDRFLDVLGMRPALGRRFTASERRTGASPAVMVTDAFWRSRLGGDRSAVGRAIRVGVHDAVVVGVLPRPFRGLRLDRPVDLYMPIRAAPLVAPPRNFFSDEVASIDGRGYSPEAWISVTARLKKGVSARRAGASVAAISNRTKAREAQDDAVVAVRASAAAVPAWTRGETARFVALLLATCGMLFAAGCASVAGMVLVRNEGRRREVAIRVCLGAGRIGLLRLFLVEALTLTSLGALAGLPVASWLVQAAGRFVVLPGGIEVGNLNVGWTAPAAAAAVALAAVGTAAACGLAPALRVMGSAAGARRSRGVVLAGQVAVVVVLTIGAALFVRSLRAAVSVDTGFDRGRLFYATLAFGLGGYDGPGAANFYDTVVERLRSAPGVEGVTFGNLPLARRGIGIPEVRVEGRARRVPGLIDVFFCGPEYARTVGLRLLAGRDFESRDVAGSEPVALVTESLARHLWTGGSPVGRRFAFLPREPDVRVVGVVRDGRYGGLRDVDGFALFLPWRQNRELAFAVGTVIGRAAQDAGGLVSVVRREVRAFDAGLPILEASTLQDRIGALTRPQRVGAFLMSGFGGFALLLAVLGVYGSVERTLAGRRRELGIRMALGAPAAAVVGTALSGTLAYVGIGAAAGVGAAAVFARLAEPYLFGIGPHDPAAYAATTAAVVAAAVLAGLAAALRAVRAAAANTLIREAACAE